jgi:hypothetical protein
MTKLIPDDLISTIPDLYSTEDEEDPICHIKLFTPDANWTWYITELSIEDNDTTCFGYIVGLESELGYFSLAEIEAIRGHLKLPVERDLGFTPTRLSEVKKRS